MREVNRLAGLMPRLGAGALPKCSSTENVVRGGTHVFQARTELTRRA
jgi:hypothetical protein